LSVYKYVTCSDFIFEVIGIGRALNRNSFHIKLVYYPLQNQEFAEWNKVKSRKLLLPQICPTNYKMPNTIMGNKLCVFMDYCRTYRRSWMKRQRAPYTSVSGPWFLLTCFRSIYFWRS